MEKHIEAYLVKRVKALGGVGAGAVAAEEKANREKFEELLAKERDLNNFMDGFPSRKSTKQQDVETILDAKSLTFLEKIGDWFVLHLVVKNLDTLTINELIKQLHKDQETTNANTETLKLKPETSQV